MEIKDLKKGSNLERSSGTGGPTSLWNYVTKDRENIGIGIFLEDDTTPTSAIVVNEDGYKEVLNELNGGHPEDENAKEHLENMFAHYFPNTKIQNKT